MYIVRLQAVTAQAEVRSVEQHSGTVMLELGNWEGVDRATIHRVVGSIQQPNQLQVRLEAWLMDQD